MWTQQDEIKSLKSMLDSCFAYDSISDVNDYRKTYSFAQYVLPFEKKLGKPLFDEIYNAHLINLIQNFKVERGVFTDGEGCTYNSLVAK
jgi:hypothetical protein